MQSHVSSVESAELLLFHTLLQLSVIVLAGRLGGWLALRSRQTPAVGEIMMGIVLGPSLLGWLLPYVFHYVFRSSSPEPLTIMSQVGLLLLMFQVGLEFDFSHLANKACRRSTLSIALACIVLPLLLGGISAWYFIPHTSPGVAHWPAVLFVATAFSITALPVLGRILTDFGMERTPLGVIAISAAAVNDVVGWLLLAAITTLVSAGFVGTGFALRIFGVLAFFVACVLLVRPALKRLLVNLQTREAALPPNLLGIVLVAIFLAGMTTYHLGIFAIFGGFMLGAMLHDEQRFVEAWKEKVGGFVTVFFLPIFFTYTGLRTNISALGSLQDWLWCALVLLLAFAGKMLGAYMAARWQGMDRRDSGMLAVLMNTRALMELVVINVGYDLGVISQNVFSMLVIMAVASTLLTSPCLYRYLQVRRGEVLVHGS